MTDDNLIPKENHKYNTRSKIIKNKVNYDEEIGSSNSDDESDNDINLDNISEISKRDRIVNINQNDYHKLLSELFPSKYMREKARATNHLHNKRKKQLSSSEESEESEENEENEESEKGEKDKNFKYKKQKQKFKIYFNKHSKHKNKKFKTKRPYSEGEDSEDEEYKEDSEDSEDSEDEEYKVDSEDEYSQNEDSEDEDSEDEDPDNKNDNDNEINEINEINENIKIKSSNMIIEKNENFLNKFKKLAEDLKQHDNNNNNKSKILRDMINYNNKKERQLKQEKERIEKKKKNRLFKKFEKILDQDISFDEEKYFKNKLDIVTQENTIEEFAQIKAATVIDKPYLIKLIESPIPIAFKSVAYKKISTLRNMSDSGEFYKIKTWIDTFMKIPFGSYNSLPITIDDGLNQCHEFMANAKRVLDEAVFGLNDAKLQIMQLIGQWIVNPSAIGTTIAIKGPMGTGKTTLVKEGISKILNRPFSFIALGGATDSAFLEGHSYTYEGSMHGKIVDILIQTQSMNPVIYCDELDKLSDTPKGEEITGILTHLTDPAQNEQFHDKYFAELDFNLSRTLLIFSYNDESKINPILRDRMYRIETKGYSKEEKTTIAQNYLLPKIQEQLNIESGKIIIPIETLHHIIDKYTEKEDGVRNLKRCLEIIYTKLNLYRLMKPGVNLFEKDLTLKIEFPTEAGASITITEHMIDKLIKKHDDQDEPPYGMYN
jgi:ATP-dependent Lon protease